MLLSLCVFINIPFSIFLFWAHPDSPQMLHFLFLHSFLWNLPISLGSGWALSRSSRACAGGCGTPIPATHFLFTIILITTAVKPSCDLGEQEAISLDGLLTSPPQNYKHLEVTTIRKGPRQPFCAVVLLVFLLARVHLEGGGAVPVFVASHVYAFVAL